jgi:hypothetical protein
VAFRGVIRWELGFLSNFGSETLDGIEKKLILKNHEDFVMVPGWEKYAENEPIIIGKVSCGLPDLG